MARRTVFTNSHVATPRLLAIPGSIRKASANAAVLEALRARVETGGHATLRLYRIDALPLFSVDLEGERLPETVRDWQDAVRSSDGLVICTPEYNYGMPGVLKNALDWASRPSLQSPLKGKPALIMSAATASTGGVRAIAQVRDTLVGSLARVVSRPDVVVCKVHEKIIDGKFVDESVLSFAAQAVEDLLADIRLYQAPRGTRERAAE
jgi:chromate reductase, NAD(P)H dehydrogenase (quinone)